MPSGPAAVGEPGTGGMPVEIDAYFASRWGVVAMSETDSNCECILLPRPVSQPARAMVVSARRAAARIGEAGLMFLQGWSEFGV